MPDTMSFDLDTLRELHRHMEWADATVWAAALSHPPAQQDARLRDLLLHLHNVQRAFLHVWTNQPLAWPKPEDFPDIASVQRWSHPVYAAGRAFFDATDPDALARPMVMPWASQLAQRLGREPQHPTLAETIFQVTSHSTYHRGQVNVRLREVGGVPPLVDYIAWVWFGKPEPQWQEAT
jgi:uncharacterized damage-inducible protein DinB